MLSFLTPYLLWIKLAGVALLMIGAAYCGYRWELGAYNGLVAADAIATKNAVTAARAKDAKIAKSNQEDAVAEALFQGRLEGSTVNLVLGVPANVTITQDQEAAAADHAGCITYGFVRVLVAGQRGVSADALALPSGESVDACTGWTPSGLAATLAKILAAGTGDAHQLNDLEAAVVRNDAIVTAPLSK